MNPAGPVAVLLWLVVFLVVLYVVLRLAAVL